MFVVKSGMNSGIFVVFFVIEHFGKRFEQNRRFYYMKSIFEQSGGTYTMQGDYRLPNLTLPAEEERPIGVWGQRRLRYLKQYHKVIYYNLLTSGKLHSHLVDIDEEAQELFLRLEKEYAENESVTEQLKEENPIEWIRKMNNIKMRVREMVNLEVIFA